jgi:DNA-binding IclR family transcriptional regulator
MDGAMEDQIPVKSLGTTYDVLNTLIDLRSTSFTKLVDELDYPKSTIFDHLRSLEMLGLVVKQDGEYRVSFKFLDIGERLRNELEIYDMAQPEIQRLASETGEHASLMFEENGHGVLLYTVRGDQAIHYIAHDGLKTDLHATGQGKAILAHLPPERRTEILQNLTLRPFTSNTITDENELREHLDMIRDRGYAYDRKEALEGMHGIAVPIVDIRGRVRGSIGVYGPESRTDTKEFETETLEHLRQSRNVIEVELTYS